MFPDGRVVVTRCAGFIASALISSNFAEFHVVVIAGIDAGAHSDDPVRRLCAARRVFRITASH
jgi:hypothetical protein